MRRVPRLALLALAEDLKPYHISNLAHGWTQETLAEAAGVSQPSISRMLGGYPGSVNRKKFRQLCQRLREMYPGNEWDPNRYLYLKAEDIGSYGSPVSLSAIVNGWLHRTQDGIVYIELPLDSGDKKKEHNFEEEINSLLREAVCSVKNSPSDSEKDGSVKKFLCGLKELPLFYRSLSMTIQFDPDTEDIERYKTNLQEKLGSSPVNGDGLTYEISLLIPREPTLRDSVSSHGSPHRDTFFSQGEIATIERSYDRFDKQTRNSNVLRINPAKLGALSVEDRLGVYFVFPRQISGIKLSRSIPRYLNEGEIGFVSRFYKDVRIFRLDGFGP